MAYDAHSRSCSRKAIALSTSLLIMGAAGFESEARADYHQDEAIYSANEELGTVDFRVSCAEDSRESFDQALAFMHHMMYAQSQSAFEAIVERDPNCAMARWGVATTLFQPLWPTRPSAEDLQRGWDEIEQLKANPPETDRERKLLAATEGFFRDPETVDWWPRIQRWAEGMETAYEAHPDDFDIAALYALSRLALGPVADDRAVLHDEAEAVLLTVHEAEPMHPGGIHYLIHTNDAAGRAGRSLDIVRSYSDIAPEVPHALHMPTHIFVRLGEWPEVIEWNRRSADAALNYPAGEAISHHYPHATDYLVYAFLQQGEDEKAKAVVDETLSKTGYQRSFVSAFHMASIPARYEVERRQWEEAAALEPRQPDDLPWDNSLWAEGLTWLARGLGAVHTGDLEAAKQAEKRLAKLRDAAEAAGEADFGTYIEIDRLIVAGWMARAEGEDEDAVRLISRAAELEGTVEKHPVTPGALLPPYEALGDLLLDLERYAEALEAYKASDDVWPKRYNTLLGAARAAAAAGDEEAASAHYAELLEMAGNSERSEVIEAKEFLTN
jgi:tetratricopeptide (TPR) repeat protein